MEILLKNGHIVDFVDRYEGIGDLLIKNGIIAKRGVNIKSKSARIIDCSDRIIMPGICDMHVHLRDPGQTHKEDLITGGEAAVAGGITAVACMPNTTPPIDSPEVINDIVKRAKKSKVKIYPVATITKGLEGKELCDYEDLKDAGAVAVSDDGRPVEKTRIMADAMVKAHYAGLKVISHCEDLELIDGGIINKGKVSKKLGVKGMSRLSEDTITARELAIAHDLQMPIHIAHVSTKGAVSLIRGSLNVGTMCTCETCPHYFSLTDKELLKKDADYRMNPPLRDEDDVMAIQAAIADGTIDCIVTDHAPHSAEEKADFKKAPNGVVGMETSLAVTLTELYHKGVIGLLQIVKLMCVNPRKILGIEGGSLGVGDVADIAIIDINEEWVVHPEKLRSKSKNTCFKGKTLKGKVKYTLVNGKLVYKD